MSQLSMATVLSRVASRCIGRNQPFHCYTVPHNTTEDGQEGTGDQKEVEKSNALTLASAAVVSHQLTLWKEVR